MWVIVDLQLTPVPKLTEQLSFKNQAVMPLGSDAYSYSGKTTNTIIELCCHLLRKCVSGIMFCYKMIGSMNSLLVAV